MRKIVSLVILYFSIVYAKAQITSINVGKTKVEVTGNLISEVRLLNNGGKPGGKIYVYYHFTNQGLRLVQFHTNSKAAAYLASVQYLPYYQLKNNKINFEVRKSYIDPENQTLPKQTWDLSIDIRTSNNEVAEVGTEDWYSDQGDHTEHLKSNGMSRVLTFKTKQEAEKFVNVLKTRLSPYTKL